jgi:hypothetical protein
VVIQRTSALILPFLQKIPKIKRVIIALKGIHTKSALDVCTEVSCYPAIIIKDYDSPIGKNRMSFAVSLEFLYFTSANPFRKMVGLTELS